MMSEFHISTDKEVLDLSLIHRYLSEQSSWAKGIPLSSVAKSIAHSLCFGGFVQNEQVAFARVISDYATFAYLLDVFVLEPHRGKGYSKLLMQAVLTHAELQGLRRFMLATSTAHGLYAKMGFMPLATSNTIMQIHKLNPYQPQGN
jgi:GNAT superfamily N-acetyltransferase